MANYVFDRIICTKEDFSRYFLDCDPFGECKLIDRPYITFRLWGRFSIRCICI